MEEFWKGQWKQGRPKTPEDRPLVPKEWKQGHPKTPEEQEHPKMPEVASRMLVEWDGRPRSSLSTNFQRLVITFSFMNFFLLPQKKFQTFSFLFFPKGGA